MIAENLTMNDLFLQLGLDNDDESIDAFIESHKGIPSATRLEDASFWSDSQATFVRSALLEDAEWAELIDHLDSMLR
ncbi:DUF2789 domain-containing protein [Aliiglaciecola litoralis]|uniref:DUF2789 domain-containing protein n=1 Tax=Aliiglaciecola litoralis TaxID=582857 RepID=A0ABP3WW09_9ALTE